LPISERRVNLPFVRAWDVAHRTTNGVLSSALQYVLALKNANITRWASLSKVHDFLSNWSERVTTKRLQKAMQGTKNSVESAQRFNKREQGDLSRRKNQKVTAMNTRTKETDHNLRQLNSYTCAPTSRTCRSGR
jgi:hypothetical protein